MKKFILLFLVALGCIRCDYFDSIYMYNHSNQTVWIHGDWYPMNGDTAITFRKEELSKTERFDKCMLESVRGDLFYELRGQRYTIFIFHPDTLKKYSWEEVVNGYKIICRYDLDVPLDIEHLNKDIPYPPTKAMSGMKVYYPTVASDSVASDSVVKPSFL